MLSNLSVDMLLEFGCLNVRVLELWIYIYIEVYR